MAEQFIENAYKIILGKNRTRIVAYENLRIQKNEAIPKMTKEEQQTYSSKYIWYNYKKRLRTRRETLREIAYNNFNQNMSTMITLTFEPKEGVDFTNLQVAHREFKKFIQRMMSHYDNFNYAATFSRQKKGNWHYHILSNLLPETKSKDIEKVWRNGGVYITAIEKKELFDRCVQYLVDNMSDAADYTRGQKGYLTSKNMVRNLVLKSYVEEDFEKFQKVFEEIRKQPYRILYSTEKHLGIQLQVKDEKSEENYILTETHAYLTPELEKMGYEDWKTIYTYLNSPVHFKDLFKPILPATPKPKSRRKRKNGKNKP